MGAHMTRDEEIYVELMARAVRSGSIAAAAPIYRKALAVERRIRRARRAA